MWLLVLSEPVELHHGVGERLGEGTEGGDHPEHYTTQPELSPVWKISRIRELFREHMICKHNKLEFYIPVNVVIRELVGGIEKTHGGE